MKSAVLIVFFLTSFFTGFTQAKATADRDSILIGEQIKLKVQGQFQKGQDQWPRLDTIPRFEVLEKSEVDRKEDGNLVTLTQTLTITSWDSGVLFIPPLNIGNSVTAPIRINVAYAPHPFDTSQPYHPLHDILEVKKEPETTWYWYLIGLLVLILLFLLFFPKGKPKPKPDFVPDANAYKKAMQRLDELKRKENLESKIFYTELVQIFRDYLHKRKNIYSYSKTTDDLAIQVDSLNMDRELYQHLLQTLRLSDSVKYAKYQPGVEENGNAIEIIKESITAIESSPHGYRDKPQTSNL
jgi:hypothetical protein